mgnify:CR=1 FL=1
MREHHSVIWNSEEAAIVTGGENTQPWVATGVSMNIDELQAGDLFVASKEDDLELVFQKGAAAVMQAKCMPASDKIPTLYVPETFAALQCLARAARFKSHATIVAVQGRGARVMFGDVLSKVGTTHKSGRHLSLAMASQPADIDFGVFGFSPAVQPDIAVITNCESARRDTMFENMPAHGAAIINADDDDFLSVLGRAKAAGLKHVYSYGQGNHADVRLSEIIEAGNGVRLSVDVMGDQYTFLLPLGFVYDSALLATLLVLKLTDKCLESAMRPYANILDQKTSVKNTITLADPSLEKTQAVFRVTNMIDLGMGRQTAILDNISRSAHKALTLKKAGFSVPDKLAHLDFVHTGKSVATVSNARAEIQARHGNVGLESIIPDVIVPGDFLVFKGLWNKSKTIFSEALRLTPDHRKREPANAHTKIFTETV